MGFNQGTEESTYERMKQKVNDELKRHFRPEFLNRIDDVVVFHQLTTTEINKMVDLMLKRVEGALKNKDMSLEVTDGAKTLLGERGFDPALGARPLRRTIQREIEDKLSEKILFDEIRPGQIILVDIEGEGKEREFTFRGEPKPSVVPEVVPVGLATDAGEAGGA
jgi:ATP-dependent Clp protease ATP-binding subunit ClpC